MMPTAKVPHLSREMRQQTLHYFAMIYLGVMVCQSVVVLAILGWMVSNRRTPSCQFLGAYNVPAYMITAANGSLLCIAVVGCVVARFKKGSQFFRYFMMALTTVVLLEFIAGMFAAVYLAQVEGSIFDVKFTVLLRDYETDTSAAECWDTLHEELQCCGAEEYTDWEFLSTDWHSGNISVPQSCDCVTEKQRKDSSRRKRDPSCLLLNGTKTLNNTSQPFQRKVFEKGCGATMKREIRQTMVLLVSIGFGISLIQVVMTAFNFFMASRIENSSVVEAYIVPDDATLVNPNDRRVDSLTNARQTTSLTFVTTTTGETRGQNEAGGDADNTDVKEVCD